MRIISGELTLEEKLALAARLLEAYKAQRAPPERGERDLWEFVRDHRDNFMNSDTRFFATAKAFRETLKQLKARGTGGGGEPQ